MKAKKPGATTPAARKATRSRGTAKPATTDDLDQLAGTLGLSAELARNALYYAAHPSNRFGVACTQEEMHRWDRASRPASASLSEWVRAVLNEKADSILEARTKKGGVQ